MIYLCGTDKDYNDWADYVGNADLNFENMLKYRAKLEKNVDIANDPIFHSTTGKILITNASVTDEIIEVITEGFKQLNLPYVGDFNKNASYVGIFDAQFTIGAGERCSSARAYLQDVKSNLFVMKNSIVTRVIFDSEKRATGVEVNTKNSECPSLQVYADKEVILSAGALNTPKILLQSGIGKIEDLTPYKISQIADVPVGYNLQDHVYGMTLLSITRIHSNSLIAEYSKESIRYMLRREGILANAGYARRHIFVNFDEDSGTKSSYPDMQLHIERIPRDVTGTVDVGFRKEVEDVLLALNDDQDVLLVVTAITNPKSMGTVKLQSSDFSQAPNITAGFFTDAEDADLNKMIQSFQLVQKFSETPAMSALNAKIIKFNFTNCQIEGPFWSSEYLNCYRKFFTSSSFHPSGTVKMGKSSDPTAVLNEEFKVKGVKNLRVVDASVFPKIPSSNLQCPIYTIAEYAADIIKHSASN